MDRLKTKLQVKSFITKKIINEINRKIGASCLLEKKNEGSLYQFSFQPLVDAGLAFQGPPGSQFDYTKLTPIQKQLLGPEQPNSEQPNSEQGDPNNGVVAGNPSQNLNYQYRVVKSTKIPDNSMSWEEASDSAWKLQALAPLLQMIPGPVGRATRKIGTLINIGNPAVQTSRAVADSSTDSASSAALSFLPFVFRPQQPLPSRRTVQTIPARNLAFVPLMRSVHEVGGRQMRGSPTSNSGNPAPQGWTPSVGGVAPLPPTWDEFYGQRIMARTPSSPPHEYGEGLLAMAFPGPVSEVPSNWLLPQGHMDNEIRRRLRELLYQNPRDVFMTNRKLDRNWIEELIPVPARLDPSHRQLADQFGIKRATPAEPSTNPGDILAGISSIIPGTQGLQPGRISTARSAGQYTRGQPVVIDTPVPDPSRRPGTSTTLSMLPGVEDYVSVRPVGPPVPIRPTWVPRQAKIGVNTAVAAGAWGPLATPDGYSVLSNPVSTVKGLSPIGQEDYEHPWSDLEETLPENPHYYIPKNDIGWWDRLTWFKKTPEERLQTLKNSQSSKEEKTADAINIFTNPKTAEEYFRSKQTEGLPEAWQ